MGPLHVAPKPAINGSADGGFRCAALRRHRQASRRASTHPTAQIGMNRTDISDRLAAVGYIADRELATALWLMEFLKRPLLIEGEAGVGKTEVGKALAAVHGAELIRLQCYKASTRTPRSTNGTTSASCSSDRCSPRSAASIPRFS